MTRIGIDTSSLTSARQQADALNGQLTHLDRNGRLRQANGRFAGNGNGGKGGGIGGGGSLLKMAMPYLGAAAIGAAMMSIGSKAMAQERDQFSLEVMLKSPEMAKTMMGQFQTFAKKNPMMGMAEVTEAGTRLVSLNERTDRVMPIVSALSDVAAGTKNKLSDMTSILGQVKSKGRLMAEENMQFQERRINLNPYLAKVTGVKQDQLADLMKDGKIGYEQVLRAINLMTTKGGIYEGMSDRMGKETSSGRLQNLLETMELQFVQLGLRTLPYVNKGLEFASTLMDGLSDGLNGPLGHAFMVAVDGVSTLGGSIWRFALSLGLVSDKAGETGILMRSLQTGFNILGAVGRGLGWIFDKLSAFAKFAGLQQSQNGPSILGLLEGSFADGGRFGATRKPLETKAKPITQEERWMKSQSADFAQLSGEDRHQRFVEAKWRASQSNEFKNLGQQQQHDRFIAAQTRALKANTSLLGASGVLGGLGKAGKVGADLGKAGGVSAGVTGAKSTHITISLKSLVDQVHVHSATVGEGMEQMRDIVTDELLRVLNSANALAD